VRGAICPLGEKPRTAENPAAFWGRGVSPVCFEPGSFRCGEKTLPGFHAHPPNGRKTHNFVTYRLRVPRTGGPRGWTFRLANLPPALVQASSLRLREYRIDHTNPCTDYVLNGKDSGQGRYNLETGSLELLRTETIPGDRRKIALHAELPGMSISLLEWEPLPGP